MKVHERLQKIMNEEQMMGVRIPPELFSAIKHLSVDKRTSMQALAIEAFEDLLKKHKGQK